jgi:hypothetical protein
LPASYPTAINCVGLPTSTLRDAGDLPKPEDCHDGMEPPTKPGPDGSYPVCEPGKTKLI